ncbi:MAG TPA: hypothetical protein VEI81_01765 [Methanoregula sp.]|nr:hypothetical protein [Methanoregula sp.]
MNPRSAEAATSNLTGTLLMIVIAIILAALILTQLFTLPAFGDARVPDNLQITTIRHVDDQGRLNNEGWVTLINNGPEDYVNWNLCAKTFVNDVPVPATISTMNADETCHTVHDGIRGIGGLGTDGNRRSPLAKWYSGQPVYIDYNNNLIHPGDRVTIEFYEKSTGRILSRDSWPRTDPRSEPDWWIGEFTHPDT